MQCKNCQQNFTITDVDRDFYRKIDMPEPTWCPECRFIRRGSWRNERFLYKDQCDLCHKEIISMYSPQAPFPVYCTACYYSDDWDPLKHGRDYQSGQNFFTQYAALQQVVPHLALNLVSAINNEYSNYAAYSKNCYLSASITYSEDVYYSKNIDRSFFCFDSYDCQDSEMIYDCFNCSYSHSLIHCVDCHDCLDCRFCYDCRGCQNCFSCWNLRNKSYYFLNQQLTKEEYLEKVKNLDIGSYQNYQQQRTNFLNNIAHQAVHRFAHIVKSYNCVGDYIGSSKNIRNGFFCYEAEDCAYVERAFKDSKDVVDSYAAGQCELFYEDIGGMKGFNNFFSVLSTEASFCQYTYVCVGGINLFGCISARRQKYCLLNKQYTEEEYKKLLPKIIQDMKGRGEYGEFFPPAFSPFGYNESIACEYTFFNKEEVLAKGWRWQDELPGTFGQETLKDIPNNIKDTTESITKEILACIDCGRNYKIIKQELEFYQKLGLPLPRQCPDCRHFQRLKLRNPRKLYLRQCLNPGCQNQFQTTYAPDRPEKVYCEACYNKEIY